MIRASFARIALRTGAVLVLAAGASACGARSSLLVEGSPHAAGTEGGPCDANGGCDAGLACVGGTCVGSGAGDVHAPSCAAGGPGLSDCGDGTESCCTSLLVPGGTYFRTYTNAGSGPTEEADPATISTFRLDKYEVTVGRFRQFVQALNAGWRPAPGSGKHAHLNGGQGLASVGDGATAPYEPGWDKDYGDLVLPGNTANFECDPIEAPYVTWTDAPGSQERYPINCMTSYMAYAFCIWDGGFLPSEAEWEYAAAGGEEERAYVWGTADPGTSSQYAVFDCLYPSGSGQPCSGLSNIAPVGTARLGAGAWGHLDLAGNMAEWTLDYGNGDLWVSPCTDCAYVTIKPDVVGTPYLYRMVRGSSFDDGSSPPIFLLPPGRNDASATGHDRNIGFRCARAP